MNFKKSENKINDGEILSVGDEKIRSLIGNLKRVEAPKDFDFRVKARIAGVQSAQSRPRFSPAPRYILPLSLIILICAAAVLNSVYFVDTQSVPQIAENNFQAPAKEENQSGKSSPSVQIDIANLSPKLKNNSLKASGSGSNILPTKAKKIVRSSEIAPQVAALKTGRKPAASLPGENKIEDAGGSHTSTLKSAQIISPPGINPSQAVKTSPNSDNSESFTAKEILSQLGVEAVFTNESWKVKSVRQNSPAGRSGVQTGDEIEAIGDEKLTDKPLQSKTIEVKKLTVVRGAEKIEIFLSNQSN